MNDIKNVRFQQLNEDDLDPTPAEVAVLIFGFVVVATALVLIAIGQWGPMLETLVRHLQHVRL